MDAWEWVVPQKLSDIEIRKIVVFTDFISLHFCRFLTDLSPLKVDLGELQHLERPHPVLHLIRLEGEFVGLQTRPSVLLQVYRARIASVDQTGLNHGSLGGET